MKAASQFAERLAGFERDDRIVVELRDKVLWLRIDRAAQHNALALSMLESIAQVLTIAQKQLSVSPDQDWLRLGVIVGAGERSSTANERRRA